MDQKLKKSYGFIKELMDKTNKLNTEIILLKEYSIHVHGKVIIMNQTMLI